MESHPVFIVTGIPASGKTTVSHLLARRFPRSAHVEADRLQAMIVSGVRWPDQAPLEEATTQLELRARNAAGLGASFHEAGFVAVLDDVIVGRRRLALYLDRLPRQAVRLVVLAPPVGIVLERDRTRADKHVGARWMHLDAEQRADLGDLGLWLDTGELDPRETVDAILAPEALRAARLPDHL